MSKISTYKGNGIFRALLTLTIYASAQQVGAASFALKEQSVTYLGNAFAGTSSGSDASSTYYNPAALVELKHSQAILSATYVNAHLKLYDATARTNGGSVVANSVNPTKPKSHGLVPGMFLAWKLTNSYTLGFGVYSPFGLNTHYSQTDIARYMATDSKITAVSLSPSISYRVNDHFSVGAALDFMRVKATLASNLNFGAEGYSINKAQGWTYGYHVGLLYKPSAVTKMGLAYFSKFDPRVKGTTQTYRYPVSPPTKLQSKVKLPDRINYSVTHEYTNQWTAMGEVEWTHWSRLRSLRLDYDIGSPATEFFFYKNTFRFSLGADYKYTPALTFKGGLSYEQSPTITAYRSARVPDSNRYWLAVGLKYMFNKNISIDGAYAHLFVKNAQIAQRGVAPSASSLNGNYKSSADIVGVQLTWNFV